MSATPPYGYTLVKSGIYSKRGIERKKLKILPDEAEVVKLVYRLCAEEGYGGRRISIFLNEKGIPSKKGTGWTLSVINYMLRNPIYKGYISYNKTSVKKNGTQGRIGSKNWILSEERNDEIAIVSEEQWEKVQKIRWAKTPDRFKEENIDYESYPLSTKSEGLLTGIARCGYCGAKMNLAKNSKNYKKKNGDITVGKIYNYYRCIGKTAGKNNCSMKKSCIKKDDIEKPVLEAINLFLNSLEKVDLSKQIENIKKANISEENETLKSIEKNITNKENEISKLKDEVMKSLLGESSFDKEMLSEMIKTRENELKNLICRKSKTEELIENKKIEYEDISVLKQCIPVWINEFNNATTENKKMLINQIVNDVEVFDDEIKVKMKIDFDELLSNNFFLQNVLKSRHS